MNVFIRFTARTVTLGNLVFRLTIVVFLYSHTALRMYYRFNHTSWRFSYSSMAQITRTEDILHDVPLCDRQI